jgi:hypothetical protein
MAKNKNTIKIYRDWIEIFKFLSDEDAGKLTKHLFEYVNDLNPEEPTGIIGMAWIPIKSQLKRDLKKWESICERNAINGAKGGRPPKPTGLSGLKNKPKKADKDKDKDKDIYIPAFSDFLSYAIEKKPSVNREALKLKYDAWKMNDWRDGNDKPIKSWKLKLTNTLPYIKEDAKSDPYNYKPKFV